MYTVILLYPAHLCTDGVPYGQEIYVGLMDEGLISNAIGKAKLEIATACTKDGKTAVPEDFKLVAVFEGEHMPLLFGWQKV